MNFYYSKAPNRTNYRRFIGRSWDSGKLQFDFLVNNGLLPAMKLLEIGCGCLRGGVHFINYLNANHYYGTDVNPVLVEFGLTLEVPLLGLEKKISADHFQISAHFDFTNLPNDFDMVFAHSVFSHLPLNHLYFCLLNLAAKVKMGARFFMSLWTCPEHETIQTIRTQGTGVMTHFLKAPFHYKASHIQQLQIHPDIFPLWDVVYVGDWQYPEGHEMFCFTRK